MLPSRRALFYHANSFLLRSKSRYHCHTNYVCSFSSISHKNQFQGPKSPEELSRLYKNSDGSASKVNSGSGGVRVTPEKRRDDHRNMYGEPREETADSVARTAKVAAAGALETGLRFGEMVKQTVDGIWDSTKEATENMRDSVADDTGGDQQRAFDIDDNTGRRPAQASDIDDAGRRGAQTFDIDDDVDGTGCRRAQASDIDDAGRRGAHTFAVDDVYDTGSGGAQRFDDRIQDESQDKFVEDKFVEELRRRADGYDLKDGR